MSYKIVVKANDGRGLGHILRVLNFITHDHFRDNLKLIVHKGFADQLPDRLNSALVTDERWRVNLDFRPGENIYYKKGNDNHNKTGNLNVDDSVKKALANYYFSILDNLNHDVRLVYIDDQNSPETIFPEKIAKAIGVRNPGAIKYHAPNTKISFEIETQIWDFIGNNGMGTTRQECFSKVDYIHLSSDADFFKAVVGKYPFGEYSHKIIPMGFPVSSEKLNRFNEMKLSSSLKDKYRQEMLTRTASDKQRICYSTFGAGEGAEQVIDTLLDSIDSRSDCLFITNDPRGGLLAKLKSTKVGNPDGNLSDAFKYNIESVNGKGITKVKTKKGNDLFLITDNTLSGHLDYLASSDLVIQGAGSGTTYEGIASGVPLISLPLNRPGYEQIIKGMGIEIFNCGKVLYIDEVQDQVNSFYNLTESYGHSVRGIGKSCTANNLLNCIEDMFSKKDDFKASSSSMEDFFAIPYKTMRTLDDMASQYDVPTIIRNNDLKHF